jgi:hypothetical protein
VWPVSFSGLANRSIWPIWAAIVKATTQPIPGTVRSSGMWGWSAWLALSRRLTSAI